jgi:hypothetical protein
MKHYETKAEAEKAAQAVLYKVHTGQQNLMNLFGPPVRRRQKPSGFKAWLRPMFTVLLKWTYKP